MSGSRHVVLLVVGTRPEAVKLAPVATAVSARPGLVARVLTTGQHPEMAESTLGALGVAVDRRLELPRDRGPSQAALVSALLPALEAEAADGVAAVVVQGDTASVLAGGLAALWAAVPLVHVEAGLRSGDLRAPFPEEAYRRLVAPITALHLAPTPRAVRNLLAEGTPRAAVRLVGNTVVDAVASLAPASTDALGSRRDVLVTAHRRESWGAPLRDIAGAVARIVARVPDIEVTWPVHPNPLVRDVVIEVLGGHDRIDVVDPLDYPDLVRTLARSSLVLTDSGGIQEEAPGLGVPALVLREVTERSEAVEAGRARLVGTDPHRIEEAAVHLLTDEVARRAMIGSASPFGDARAGARAAAAIAELLGLAADGAVDEWRPPTPVEVGR